MRCLQGHTFILPSSSTIRLKNRHWRWRWGVISLLVSGFLLLMTTGCQLTQSGFARTVNNTGAALAAASLTLSDMHEGKVASAYARSAFANYQSELSGLDQQLPAQKGAPNTTLVQQLLSLYRPAMHVIERPCLDTSCNWHTQLTALNRARDAFLKAGG
jgi:hypothetical protein